MDVIFYNFHLKQQSRWLWRLEEKNAIIRKMIALIDYKAGNLTSVQLAFAAIGAETVVTHDPAVVRHAERVVFPGVGAARHAMMNLQALGLDAVVREAVSSGKPFLGICLGMQILFEKSEEDGGVETLGILPGKVKKFPTVPGCKIPQIGWNQVQFTDGRPMADYYFVHSYCAEKGAFTFGTTEYAGITFTSAVKKENLIAYQFHPEKSGREGLKLLKEFLAC